MKATVVIFARTKKEAIAEACIEYPDHVFEKVFKYTTGIGNNFYQFKSK